MKVLDPGHMYDLDELDRNHSSLPGVVLRFVKREGDGYPGNTGTYPGTTVQETLRVLIHRLWYIENQINDPANWVAIRSLRKGLYVLEERAARRHHLKWTKAWDPHIRWEEVPHCACHGHWLCPGEDV